MIIEIVERKKEFRVGQIVRDISQGQFYMITYLYEKTPNLGVFANLVCLRDGTVWKDFRIDKEFIIFPNKLVISNED